MKKNYDIFKIDSYKDVPGWVNDAEHIYEEVCGEFKDGDIVAEIGSLLGQSACRMASLIKDSGLNVKFYSIDLFWMIEQTFNNLTHSHQPESFLKYIQDIRELAPGISIFDIVKHPLEPLELEDYVEFVTCDEKYAYRLFDDNSMKFLWIDGDHTGDVVYNNLVNFWPKIISNGIIAGDDLVYPDVKKGVDKFINETKDISEIRLESIDGNYFFIRKI